jgi:aminoglycoside phosphotransferase (APT) family kinase protein
MNIEPCLPPDLRGPDTVLTKVSAGLSGAGVYRVDAGGQAYVLKISGVEQSLDEWREKLQYQQLAADAGLAPRMVHVDEGCRSVVTAFVADKSFPTLFMTPGTRAAALTLLGRTLRRVHDLPLPDDAKSVDGRTFLETFWGGPAKKLATPAFVSEAVGRILGEKAPSSGRALVISHNDVNPSNLVYDGENLLLVDWTTSGPNDPFYDLAAISLFMRMDVPTCQALIAAYDNAPPAELPAAFLYDRRLVAVLCVSLLLSMAQQRGEESGSGDETLESTLSLAEFYQRMRAGALDLATTEGQWAFGLSLVKESLTF